jgi:hypothetical protein
MRTKIVNNKRVPLTQAEEDQLTLDQSAPVMLPPITQYNLRIALLKAGVLAKVSIEIAKLTKAAREEAEVYWGYSLTIDREWIILNSIGLTTSEVDAIFTG